MKTRKGYQEIIDALNQMLETNWKTIILNSTISIKLLSKKNFPFSISTLIPGSTGFLCVSLLGNYPLGTNPTRQ